MKKSVKIYALFALGLFFSLLLISALASAETIGQQISSKLGSAGNPFKALGSLSDETKVSIAKLMLIFLIAIIVYAVATFLPFFPEDSPWLQWAFSIIIAVLAFIFISPGDIKLILTNFIALGIALTTIVPLMIIITFAYELRKKKPEIATFINKPLLIIFLLYLLVSWWNFDSAEEGSSALLGWIYIIAMIGTLLWLLFEKYLTKRAQEAKTESVINNAEQTSKLAVSREKQLAAAEYELSGGPSMSNVSIKRKR